jgi:hypothetical protein
MVAPASSEPIPPGAADARPAGETEPTLTPEVLRERLTLGSPALVREIYEIQLRQIQYEVGRQTRLDAKATSLLTAAGLSLTVAFTFGGQIVLAHLHDELAFHVGAVVAFAVATLCGLASAGFAIRALLVHDAFRTINEASVFSLRALKEADADYQSGAEDGDEAAVTQYRKSLIPHLLEIWQTNGRSNEDKAKIVKRGQLFFGLFLVALIVICFTVALRML